MLLCPFEDDRVPHLRPLVDTRPVYALRRGILTGLESLLKQVPHTGVQLHCRGYLQQVANAEHGHPANRLVAGTGVLFVNGRLILQPGALLDRLKALRDGNPGEVFVQDGVVVAAWMPRVPDGFKLPDAIVPETFASLPISSVSDATLIDTLPDLIYGVREAVGRDFALLTEGRLQIERPGAALHPSAIVVEPDAVFLAPGAEVRAGAILDASEGPIYLDEKALVMPGAVVRGPVFVGSGSRVNVGANVEGTAIGPGCKVGGEVHTTIFQADSNKAHQGFLGHTYVGRWCNFGADTNTSNLRNDYGPVSLYDYPTGDFVDSGRQFLGLVFGDHAKCSIDTTFNTGTVVGVGCNLYGPGFHDRFVPAFTWGEPGAYTPYRLDKFLRVAEVVMPRRDRTLTDAQREMLTHLHEEAMRLRETT